MEKIVKNTCLICKKEGIPRKRLFSGYKITKHKKIAEFTDGEYQMHFCPLPLWISFYFRLFLKCVRYSLFQKTEQVRGKLKIIARDSLGIPNYEWQYRKKRWKDFMHDMVTCK